MSIAGKKIVILGKISFLAVPYVLISPQGLVEQVAA
jgi:hypothetical protein